MEKINSQEYQKRLDELSRIMSDIAAHADQVSLCRCPYKNRLDQCTASFGCRNKRKPPEPGQLPLCAGDDKLDYRKAWETG